MIKYLKDNEYDPKSEGALIVDVLREDDNKKASWLVLISRTIFNYDKLEEPHLIGIRRTIPQITWTFLEITGITGFKRENRVLRRIIT